VKEMFRFKCDGQELRCVVHDAAASGFIDTVFAAFELCERWADMVVTVQYTQKQDGESRTFNEMLDKETGIAKVSNSLINGAVDVSIFGVNPETGARLTTEPVEIRINRSGFTSTGETPIPPTPDLYAQLLQKVEEIVKEGLSGGGGSGGTSFEVDGKTLKVENGVMFVNTADTVEADNTLPVTSAAVQTTVGNINALLETI